MSKPITLHEARQLALRAVVEAEAERAAERDAEQPTEREPYSRSQARRLMVQTGAADDATRIVAALEGLLERDAGKSVEINRRNGKYYVYLADLPWQKADTLVAALESALHAETAGEE